MATRSHLVLLMLAAAVAVATAASHSSKESSLCPIYKSQLDCSKDCDESKCVSIDGECTSKDGLLQMQTAIQDIMGTSVVGLFAKSLQTLACSASTDKAACEAPSAGGVCGWNTTATPPACGASAELAKQVAENEDLPKMAACQAHFADEAKCTGDSNCKFSDGSCSGSDALMYKGMDDLYLHIMNTQEACGKKMSEADCAAPDCEWDGSCSPSTEKTLQAVIDNCPTSLKGVTVDDFKSAAGRAQYGSILAVIFTAFALFFF